MASKRWIKRVFGVLISLGIAICIYMASKNARPTQIELSAEEQSRILNSSVQIKITVLNGSESQPHGFQSPEEILKVSKINGYTVCRGLGTVIDINGENYLVTHNHWGDYLMNADLVELSDAWGNLLLILSGAEWKSLHRYQDAGTSILQAPPELFGYLKIESGSVNRQVIPGEVVYLVHQQQGKDLRLGVLAAEVEAISEKAGRPTYQLRSLDGEPIRGGDSGGGVWRDGQLVGNLWYTIMIKKGTENSITTRQATDTSFAAKFPNSGIYEDSRKIAVGEKLYIVHQNPNAEGKLEIIAAEVNSLDSDFGLLSWTMHVPGSIIVHNDSGGGIWANGELVGNTWATGTTFNWQVWTWTSLASATTSSHTAYAASFPVHILPSLVVGEASKPVVTNLGSQHGIAVGP